MSEFIGTKLTMNLGERSYDIIVKSGSLENLYQFARLDRRVAVVTDSGVPAQYAQMVADQCKDARIITVPQGEASKSFKILESVLRQMLEFGMGRGDLVIAVGGGVVGDLAGFAASIYMRGIDFINCPTTTLSMIDSSIGGKTAVDLGDTKNIVGAFWQPKLVIVDPDTLATLPRRHFINGLAEAVKASLLADPELFAIFESGDVDAQIGEIICRSLRFKKNIVEQDETEQGMRKALNFGHTIGHGIEAVKGIKGRRTVGLYHGECVALGMLPMIDPRHCRSGCARCTAASACPPALLTIRKRCWLKCCTTKRHRAARSPLSRCRVWAAGAPRPSRWRVCVPCWALRSKP